MPLKSRLFSGDDRLEACLTQDSAHVTPGTKGKFVSKVQAALEHIDGARIDETELATDTYGPSTTAAVLAYKKKRKIINRSYQQTEDNIVGKITIERLDREMVILEDAPKVAIALPVCPALNSDSAKRSGAARRARGHDHRGPLTVSRRLN